jgi:diguanylate cyclase (GGDEF)-like protein
MELRLYELAEPHYHDAIRIDASPIPLLDAAVIDPMNLAELYQRWADEVERAAPHEDAWAEADELRSNANHHAVLAVALAQRIGSSWLCNCESLELTTRPRADAEATLPELQAAYARDDHNEQAGSRVLVGGGLARALWRTGRREEALEVARASAAASPHAGDWQVEASARWLVVEMEHEAGLPGAAGGRDYARLLSRVLWQQRLSTLAGARASIDVERLHLDRNAAQKAALEDSLTGVGNRRALDEALTAAAQDQRHPDDATSMLLVDLDGFKSFNDSYGHAFGDKVLQKVAYTLRQTARSDDLVARLGGDEFVVLARGTDAEAGAMLADRVADALSGLRIETPDGSRTITASVGVRTTGDGLDLDGLLQAADEAMYGVKRSSRPAPTTA